MFKSSSFLALFLFTILSSTNSVEAIALTCDGNIGYSFSQVVGIWICVVLGIALLSGCIRAACSLSSSSKTIYYTTAATTGTDSATTEASANQVVVDMEHAAEPPKEPLLPK